MNKTKKILLLGLIISLISIITIQSVMLYDDLGIIQPNNVDTGSLYWDKPEFREELSSKSWKLAAATSSRVSEPIYFLIRYISDGDTEKAFEIFELFDKHNLVIVDRDRVIKR